MFEQRGLSRETWRFGITITAGAYEKETGYKTEVPANKNLYKDKNLGSN